MTDIQFNLHYLYHVLAMMFLLLLFFFLFLSKPMKKISNFLATWIERKMDLEVLFERDTFNEKFIIALAIVLGFITPIFLFGDLKRFEFNESNLLVTTLPFGSSEVIDYIDLELVYMFDDGSEAIPSLRVGEEVLCIRFKESSDTFYYLRSATNLRLAEKYYPIHVTNPDLITTTKVHSLFKGKFAEFVNSLNYVINKKSQK